MNTTVQRAFVRYPSRSITLNSQIRRTNGNTCKRVFQAFSPFTTISRSMASRPDNEAAIAESVKPIYTYIEDVEPLDRYIVGGYHPVRIGDRLHDRYQVVHKLGFGTYSTTWLARDETARTYVALKIGVGNAQSLPESQILHLFRNTGTSAHPGRAMIPSVIDEFSFKGPNGQHRCLVTDLARASIAETREASNQRLFKLSAARALSAQLIQAVAFLHSQGVVHSDLHEGNLLLRLPHSFNDLSPSQLYKIYGQPKLEPVVRLDGSPLDRGVPAHGVLPIWLGINSEDLPIAESALLVTDFGEAFQPAKCRRNYSHTPLILRPPELFLLPTSPVSFPADIWALACAVFGLLGQRPLFETWFPSEDTVLEEQVDALGHFPEEWSSLWSNRSKSFDDNLARCDGESRRTLETRFEYSIQEPRRDFDMTVIDNNEKTALLSLLTSMLAYNPADRPSAQEILKSKWMVEWGLVDLQNTLAP